MAFDGHLKFDTAIDPKGFASGISRLTKTAVAGVTAVAGALTAMGGYAVKVGADFEAGMSEVAAISGATEDQLGQLADKAKEMGASTKFSATESAEALKYMAMAGWDTQSMLDGLPGIMNLAAASGEELAGVSDIVTDALTAFGLQASDAGHFADVLAKASSSSNTNVGMMGATFKYAAPIAGALGYSIEDCAQAIGLMANAGIKGEQAGTAMRSMLTRLAKPTDDVRSAMDQLGISLTDAQGNMKPLSEIMGDLRNGFADLNEQEKASYAATIAGQEAMSGMLAIVNASEKDYEKLATSIAGADGAAEDMAATMNDNLKGQFTILKSALEGLGIEFYESIQNPLKDVVKTGIGYVENLSSAFKKGGLQGLITEFGSVVANIATEIANAAPGLIDAAVSAIQAFVSGLSENQDTLFEAAGQIVASLSQGIMNTLPSFLILALDLLQSFLGQFADNMPQVIAMGVTMLEDLANGIIQALPALIESAVTAFLNFCESIVDNFDTIIDVGVNLLLALVNGIMAALPQLIERAPKIIGDLVAAIIRNLPKVLLAGQEILRKIQEGVLSLLVSMSDVGSEIVRGLFQGIVGAGSWLLDKLRGWCGSILDGIKGFFGIHSPSKVFADEIGAFIPPGITVGVEHSMPKAERDVERSMSGFVRRAQTAVADFQGGIITRAANAGTYEFAVNHESKKKALVEMKGGTVEVRLDCEGREIARATAPYLGQQLEFEV